MLNLRIKRGLKSIPTYIAVELTPATLKTLSTVGYGLSFPSIYCCQVRIKRAGKTYGAHFNYANYSSVDEAINAAIKYSKNLLAELAEQSLVTITGKGYRGIRFETYIDNRRGTRHYQHVVSYVDPTTGKRRNKIFWHGSVPPTPGQWLHGQHTALYFAAEQCRIADTHGTCIKHGLFLGWKEKRLYWQGSPNVGYDKL